MFSNRSKEDGQAGGEHYIFHTGLVRHYKRQHSTQCGSLGEIIIPQAWGKASPTYWYGVWVVPGAQGPAGW